MANIKKINEYKRILRNLLDEEGHKGVKLRGNSYSYEGAINVIATARLRIYLRFKGSDVTIKNEETGMVTKLNMADPTSIDLLKKVFNDDWQRILNGEKKK